MNLNETARILQSQIQKTTPQINVEKPVRETDITPSSPQQSTGEEFSTFLTLLTAQIQNQDPLAPLDSTQFVEQLATFSNLELQAKGNQSLDLIAALLARQVELLTPTENTPKI